MKSPMVRVSPFMLKLVAALFFGMPKQAKIKIKVISVVDGKLFAEEVAVNKQELKENYKGPFERGTNREFWLRNTRKNVRRNSRGKFEYKGSLKMDRVRNRRKPL